MLIDRELYLPREWMEDAHRSKEAGIPPERKFLTKPEFARMMIERSIASGIPFKWVAVDAVYGDNRHLRLWLEGRQKAYVFAVSGKEYVSIGFTQFRIKDLLKDLPEDGWKRMSAGDGSKGPRFYDWLLIDVNPPEHERWSRGLLVRRSVSDPQELKAHVIYAPSTTRISEMVRVAGLRWAVEISFEDAKQQTGLDEYEARSFTGWYRHITLSMFAYALLCMLKKGAGRMIGFMMV